MSRCQRSVDWSALSAEESRTNSSIDPTAFFGCTPAPQGNAALAQQIPGPQYTPTDPSVLQSIEPSTQVCEAPSPWWADEVTGQSVDPTAAACVDPSTFACVDPSLQQAPPATGLAAYQVVPDDFVGPLGPNQIRQSQHDDLTAFDFGSFDVVGNDFTGPLADGQMRQSDYDAMQQAWLNIAAGQGMQINGSATDQTAFRQMLRDGLGSSQTFRDLITSIGNDADPTHRITANVGRSQPNVIIDNFATNDIDLDDLDQLVSNPTGAQNDALSREDFLAHFLSERQHALVNGTAFGPAHQHGIDVQNQARAERGAPGVVSQTAAPDGSGGMLARSTLSDGREHLFNIDANQNITGQTLP